MTDQQNQDDLLEQAALLFLEVSENPEDPDLQAKRDSFVQQSDSARAAYLKVEQGWRVAGGRPRSGLRVVIPTLIAFGAGLYLAAAPLKTYLLADISTGNDATQAVLASGDLAHLDAGSAIADDTEGHERKVALLRGGAFFDVSANGQPFVVSTGDVDVRVRGTSFEVSRLADGISVSVAEGRVDVMVDNEVWPLVAGSELFWDEDTGVSERLVDTKNVASWRGDQLVVEDLSIRHVAALLDRRVKGEVIVFGGLWAEERVSGTFDLTDPEAALKALAVIGGGRLLSGAPLASILLPPDGSK